MTLRQDLETGRDRVLSALNDAHDYFIYTAGAWRLLEAAVRQQGLTLALDNPATGSTVAGTDLFILVNDMGTGMAAKA